MKYYKITLITIAIISAAILAPNVRAETNEVSIYFFYGDGCPHCAKEKVFLDTLTREYDNLKIVSFEVWGESEGQRLMDRIASELNIAIPGVPLTIVGDKYMVGYYDDLTSGRAIKDRVIECGTEICPNNLGDIISGESANKQNDNSLTVEIPEKINVPLVGEIKLKDFSLPILTIIIGGLDGFNPCAMWVLLFLITLLLNMQNRRRMWLLGGTFIISSALVYFLFLSAWLNIFLFIGLTRWLQIIIALVALYTGYHHLKQWRKNRHGLVCEVTGAEKRQRTFDKLKALVQKKSLWLALGGIIVLASVVNMVELLCSAGLPAVYTSIISGAGLSAWQHYGYLMLYVFVFMLDDMIIFMIAMITLRATGVSSGKYSRYASLIGGIIMIIIGILFIFKPGWLMLG